MKRCKHCGRVKPVTLFYADNAARDGRRPECKECTAARRKIWYQANRQREIDRVRAWARANPDRVRTQKESYQASGRKKVVDRKSHLKRKFGLTLEQYGEMLEAQGGGCAICGRPPREDIALHVDHDHATGQVRGLLCFRCNNLLGDAGEKPELLSDAGAYLSLHQPPNELVLMAKARVRRLAGV